MSLQSITANQAIETAAEVVSFTSAAGTVSKWVYLKDGTDVLVMNIISWDILIAGAGIDTYADGSTYRNLFNSGDMGGTLINVSGSGSFNADFKTNDDRFVPTAPHPLVKSRNMLVFCCTDVAGNPIISGPTVSAALAKYSSWFWADQVKGMGDSKRVRQ